MNMKTGAKRISSILLSASMLLSAVPIQVAASDISGHWAEKQMQSFADRGLLNGYGNGSYGPDDTMSRAQYAALIDRAAGLIDTADLSGYTDVQKSAWYYEELAKAVKAGYMQGTSDSTMSPDADVTREQAVTMLARLLELAADEEEILALNTFTDRSQVSDWALEAFAAMVKAGYIQGTDGNALAPQKVLSRAEGVTILYRALDALQSLTEPTGTLKDGVYTGTGAGYGGTITVQMTVENGKITGLEVTKHSETGSYLKRAQKLLTTVLEKQTTEGVDAISGATRSSNGILTAINACISQAQGGADTSKTGSTGGGGGGGGSSEPVEGEDFLGALKDGVYEGKGYGYGGYIRVKVTVEGGKITAIEVTDHSTETPSWYTGYNVEQILQQVIDAQSTDVDIVSAATRSSKGILKAINDALSDAVPTVKTYQVSTWAEFLAALEDANDEGGDTIQLTADITDAGDDYTELKKEDGSSYESLTDAVSSATLGMATINKPITIDGGGHTISAGENSAYCFNISREGVVMKDLTIDGASYGKKMGGGLYLAGSKGSTGTPSLTLENVTIQNCVSYKSAMPGNGGGAIYCKGAVILTATDCTFEGNVVNVGLGGAVLAQNATVTLTGCTFKNNKAPYGGAITATGSADITVSGCTFQGNDATYGGDDIYIFDGKTPGKSGSFSNSAVTYALSGNTHGTDGESWKDYKVVLGRFLTTEETTDQNGNTTTKDYQGSGSTVFGAGHDLTFTGWERTELAEDGDKTMTGAFVLMNIPYEKFYEAEGIDHDIDAVTSATVKTYNTGKAAGSYHDGYYADNGSGKGLPDGITAEDEGVTNVKDAKILGVTYPVYVSDLSVLDSCTKLTADSSATVTVASGKSALTTKVLSGADLLFASGDYAYYVMSGEPSSYKTLSVSETDGSFSFGKATAKAREGSQMTTTVKYAGNYTAIQLNVGFEGAEASGTVTGIVLTTSDGKDYALQQVVHIWGNELGWNWDELDGNGLAGKTIDTITYYVTDTNGLYHIYTYDVDVSIKLAPTDMTAEFEDANTVTVAGLPADIEDPRMTVKTKVGRGQTATVIADNAAVSTFTMGDTTYGQISHTGATVLSEYVITVTSDNYSDIVANATYSLSGEGYVLMNIPYDAFYAAYGIDGVDAVTSATVKTYNTGKAAGSYHSGYYAWKETEDENGETTVMGLPEGVEKSEGINVAQGEILGVTYPVYVSDLSKLTGNAQITDKSSVEVTVASGKSSLTTRVLSGTQLLFASGDYAFYVLEEAPNAYMTYDVDSKTFSKTSAAAAEGSAMTTTETYGGRYTDYQLNVAFAGNEMNSVEIDGENVSVTITGIVLTTEDGDEYALQQVVHIWGNELGWNWDELDGNGLAGKTITRLTYYVTAPTGEYKVYTYDVNVYVKPQYEGTAVTGTFHADMSTLTLSGVPEGMDAPKVSVGYKVGRSTVYPVNGAAINAESLTFSVDLSVAEAAGENGTWSVTVTSDNYADCSVSFTIAD